jgi:hypothetical protein
VISKFPHGVTYTSYVAQHIWSLVHFKRYNSQHPLAGNVYNVECHTAVSRGKAAGGRAADDS